MSSTPISPIRRAWYRWKALRLPWRKKFLVGIDLHQNTYYEFHNQLAAAAAAAAATPASRMRRIVHFHDRRLSYADAATHIAPAWHQWLRHTRADPPSLAEQAHDVVRQEQLKRLAAEADARWAAKASVLEAPRAREGQDERGREREKVLGMKADVKAGDAASALPQAPAAAAQDAEPEIKMQTPDGKRHTLTRGEGPPKKLKERKDDPWKRARGVPGEEWQPKTWDPNSLAPKR